MKKLNTIKLKKGDVITTVILMVTTKGWIQTSPRLSIVLHPINDKSFHVLVGTKKTIAHYESLNNCFWLNPYM